MCGIVAVLGISSKIDKVLVECLEKLEYRGYDSSGIAYIDSQCQLQVLKTIGKVCNLKAEIAKNFTKGMIGIGHTRWATHGKVTLNNAHPHVSDGVAIVHNGIIENYVSLKNKLLARGEVFSGETDSEVIAKLISVYIKDGMSFSLAFKETIKTIVGTYAIVAIYKNDPDTLIAAKNGSPIAVGFEEGNLNLYIASDAVALASLSERILYLENGDIIECQKSQKISYKIFDSNGKAVKREVVQNTASVHDIAHTGFEDFMLKEIFEEPSVALATFQNFSPKIDIKKYESIAFVACGTSYYAGCLAKYWLEDLARIHVDVEIASEFRYRNPVLSKKTLYVFVSQSGETIDTLSALHAVQEQGFDTLAIVNVPTSSIARAACHFIQIMAGVEIGVASTKAFVAQIVSILLLGVGKEQIDIEKIISCMNEVLSNHLIFKNVAEKIRHCKSMLYLGRGASFPVALEGALKIKELAYVSAQAYPSGEIKHGPIALVDHDMYSVVLAPKDRFFQKTISNAQEILARNGRIVLISTEDAKEQLIEFAQEENVFCVFVPVMHEFLYPFLMTTAVHLVAYYTAKLNGLDVDKPRNLAKSVTVE